MTTEKKTERLVLILSPSQLREIDDWRFGERIASRSDAIRQLIDEGLTQKRAKSGAKKEPQPARKKR